jgi:hypothetical protein
LARLHSRSYDLVGTWQQFFGSLMFDFWIWIFYTGISNAGSGSGGKPSVSHQHEVSTLFLDMNTFTSHSLGISFFIYFSDIYFGSISTSIIKPPTFQLLRQHHHKQ